jgi:hypothetical protein
MGHAPRSINVLTRVDIDARATAPQAALEDLRVQDAFMLDL